MALLVEFNRTAFTIKYKYMNANIDEINRNGIDVNKEARNMCIKKDK